MRESESGVRVGKEIDAVHDLGCRLCRAVLL